MLKNLCQLECVIDNMSVRLLCDNNTPLPALKEALFQFQKYIGAIEDAAKAQQEQVKAEESSIQSSEKIEEV